MKGFIPPVLYTIFVSLSIWVGLYKCSPDPNAMGYTFLLDSSRFFSLGDDYLDALVNGIFCMAFFGALSYCILIFTFRHPKLLIYFLRLAFFFTSNYIPIKLFNDFLECIKFEEDFAMLIARFGVLVFSLVGCLAVITEHFSKNVRQFYTLTCCALISVMYMRILPGFTSWFIIGIIVIWDLFSVYSEYGPTRKIEKEKLHEINAKILNYLVYTVETNDTVESNYDAISDQESVKSEDDAETAIGMNGPTLAHTLYNEDNMHLGLGDFVFFSILVCNSATHGSILATMATIIGIIVGMFVMHIVFSSDDDFVTAPALPISVVLGLLLHFATLYFLEPLLKHVINVSLNPFYSNHSLIM